MAASSGFGVQISGTRSLKDADNSPFTAYVVQVVRNDDAHGPQLTWEITKRFSQFTAFRTSWLSKMKGDTKSLVEEVPFPSKISTGGAAAVSSRTIALDAWLKALLVLPDFDIRWHNDLLVFIGLRTVCHDGVTPEGMPRALKDAAQPVALSRAVYPPCCVGASTMTVHCVREGILKKMAISKMKASNWKKRHFRLFWIQGESDGSRSAASLVLLYYAPALFPTIASIDSATALARVDEPKGMLHLGSMARAERCPAMGARKFPFKVTVQSADGSLERTFLFNADLATIADSWISTINTYSATLRYTNKALVQKRASVAEARQSTAQKVEKERSKAAAALHARLANGTAPSDCSAKAAEAALRYRLVTWGKNEAGQVGNGEKSDCGGASVTRPQSLLFFERKRNEPVAVAVGPSTMGAINVDGRALAWGDNAFLTLGDGGKARDSQRPAFIKFPDATKAMPQRVAAIAFGDTFAMALLDSSGAFKVACWGTDAARSGVLGLGLDAGGAAIERVAVPTVVELPESAARIACGPAHAAVITESGAVFTWGCGGAGRLGSGNEKNSAVPVAVSAPDAAFAVACGAQSTHIIVGHAPRSLAQVSRSATEGGRALVTGRVASSVDFKASSRFVASGGDAASATCTAVAAAGHHALLLESDGAVMTWGDTPANGLTTNTVASQPTRLVELVEAEVFATAVACGDETSMVLSATGNVLAWGQNKHGQCANKTTLKQPAGMWISDAPAPKEVAATAFPKSERYVAIAMSANNGAAIVVHDAEGVADRIEEQERFCAVTGRGRAQPATTKELRAVFEEFDADGSGDVSVAELALMLKKLSVAANPQQVKDMLERFDADGSGGLDFEEFSYVEVVRSLQLPRSLRLRPVSTSWLTSNRDRFAETPPVTKIAAALLLCRKLATDLVLAAYAEAAASAPEDSEAAARDAELYAAFHAQILGATVMIESAATHDESSGPAPPPPSFPQLEAPPPPGPPSDEPGPPLEKEWFYTDSEDASVMHGPFTTEQLCDWHAGGHFKGGDLVRCGREGEENITIDMVLTSAS